MMRWGGKRETADQKRIRRMENDIATLDREIAMLRTELTVLRGLWNDVRGAATRWEQRLTMLENMAFDEERGPFAEDGEALR